MTTTTKKTSGTKKTTTKNRTKKTSGAKANAKVEKPTSGAKAKKTDDGLGALIAKREKMELTEEFRKIKKRSLAVACVKEATGKDGEVDRDRAYRLFVLAGGVRYKSANHEGSLKDATGQARIIVNDAMKASNEFWHKYEDVPLAVEYVKTFEKDL